MMIKQKQQIKYDRKIQNILNYKQFEENILKNSKDKISLEKWSAKLELTVNELEDALEIIQQSNRIYSRWQSNDFSITGQHFLALYYVVISWFPA